MTFQVCFSRTFQRAGLCSAAAAATTILLWKLLLWMKDEDREGGSESLCRRTRKRHTSRLLSSPPEEQLLSLREGKTVMEIQFLSFEKPNLLETDKALKWVETSGFDVANCGNCGLIFNQKSTLFSHQRTHSGGKSYFFHECVPSFSSQSAVIVHMRSHMGEKPYLCTKSRQTFSQKSNLATRDSELWAEALCMRWGWAKL